MADTIFQTLSHFFQSYGYWVIFFGVMLENAGVPVPGETVLLFNFSGAVVWAITIGCAGFLFGSNWGRLVRLVKAADLVILALVVVGAVVAGFIYARRQKKRKG